jgi:hypothetical protein
MNRIAVEIAISCILRKPVPIAYRFSLEKLRWRWSLRVMVQAANVKGWSSSICQANCLETIHVLVQKVTVVKRFDIHWINGLLCMALLVLGLSRGGSIPKPLDLHPLPQIPESPSTLGSAPC